MESPTTSREAFRATVKAAKVFLRIVHREFRFGLKLAAGIESCATSDTWSVELIDRLNAISRSTSTSTIKTSATALSLWNASTLLTDPATPSCPTSGGFTVGGSTANPQRPRFQVRTGLIVRPEVDVPSSRLTGILKSPIPSLLMAGGARKPLPRKPVPRTMTEISAVECRRDICELFLPNQSTDNLGAMFNCSDTVAQIARIKVASVSMPLRQYLNMLLSDYELDDLVPSRRRQGVVLVESHHAVPQDHFHDLLRMEADYDPSMLHIKDKQMLEIITAIHSTLTYLRKVIDSHLQSIENRSIRLSLRDFVSWAYRHFNTKNLQSAPTSAKQLLQAAQPWNPHAIYSKNRIVKEAINFFEQPKFTCDKGVLCIYAKHVVWLLRGGKDWRVAVRPGDRLMVRHLSPASLDLCRA